MASIIKQELNSLNDGKGTVHLRTTVEMDSVIAMAKAATELSGGRVGHGSGEMRVMGFIPPELWTYDPLLLKAREAKRHGDIGQYTHYVRMFFKLNPQLSPVVDKKYFTTR